MHVLIGFGAGQVVAFFAVQSAVELRFDAVHARTFSAGLAVGFVVINVNHKAMLAHAGRYVKQE